ncbi:MAG: class I SAM-dependent methyltransferase, partial [Solirubrobacterales bacterium]
MSTGPASGTLEEPQVRAMFDRIAGVYDLMHSVMTAGMHHRWRRRAVDLARAGPGDTRLDVATGPRDLALELAARVMPGGEVIGSDFSEEMLDRARIKEPGIEWEWAN